MAYILSVPQFVTSSPVVQWLHDRQYPLLCSALIEPYNS